MIKEESFSDDDTSTSSNYRAIKLQEMKNTKKTPQYGLILPKQNQLSTPKSSNIFGNDDDSDEEEGTDWVKKALKAANDKNKVKKQTRLDLQRALKEDPTIFHYDEVYDEIERSKEEQKNSNKIERKPKYINNLLKSAELRKKEQELRKDRMIQKEIEAEDASFPDKERFVTSSYKAKLEEMKRFEAEQENQDRLEAIGDVTKQKDMSGFYRHLYRQTVEKNNADLGIACESKKHNKKDDFSTVPLDDNNDLSSLDSECKFEKEKKQFVETKHIKKSFEDDVKEPEKILILSTKMDEKLDISTKSILDESVKQNNKDQEKIPEDVTKNSCKEQIANKKSKQEEKKKVNIWEKRTVGPVFAAALQRYLFRKQERLAGS